MIHIVTGLNPLDFRSGIEVLIFRMMHWEHTTRCMHKGGGFMDDEVINHLFE